VITYVDASVLLRTILGEQDQLSSWEQIEPVSSELIRVECLRVIERYRLSNALDDSLVAERRAAVLDLLRAFDLAAITESILERAGDPFPTSLATLDAIHLATALQLREEFPGVGFATHDLKLALAARSMGFPVTGT
jgi:uncharacterized protein